MATYKDWVKEAEAEGIKLIKAAKADEADVPEDNPAFQQAEVYGFQGGTHRKERG